MKGLLEAAAHPAEEVEWGRIFLGSQTEKLRGLVLSEQPKMLLPLIAWAFERAGLERPRLLKMAWMREELRAHSYLRVVEESRHILQQEGLRAIVTGEAAALLRAYPLPAMRHAHNLELLLSSPGTVIQALEAFRRLGWPPGGHPSGMPIALRHCWPGPFTTDFEDLWRDAEGAILPISDVLSEALVQGFLPGPHSFPWQIDALFAVEAGGLTPRVGERARRNGSSMVIAAGLVALEQKPVPTVLSLLAQDLVVAAARRRQGGYRRLLSGLASWKDWLTVLRSAFFPVDSRLSKGTLRAAPAHLWARLRTELHRSC